VDVTKAATTKDRSADRHLARLQHIHLFRECAVCGAYLNCPCWTHGRPQRYCSPAHKQEGYRQRLAGRPERR